MYLQDYLPHEPLTAIRGFADDWTGYVQSLKTLKYMFGQRTNIAQAFLAKVTQGKALR